MIKMIFLVISIVSFEPDGKLTVDTTVRAFPTLPICINAAKTMEKPLDGMVTVRECVSVSVPKERVS